MSVILLIIIIFILLFALIFGNKLITKDVLRSVLPYDDKTNKCVSDIYADNLNGDEMAIAASRACAVRKIRGDKDYPQVCKDVEADLLNALELSYAGCLSTPKK